jgi:hypothetical protein
MCLGLSGLASPDHEKKARHACSSTFIFLFEWANDVSSTYYLKKNKNKWWIIYRGEDISSMITILSVNNASSTGYILATSGGVKFTWKLNNSKDMKKLFSVFFFHIKISKKHNKKLNKSIFNLITTFNQ